MNETIGKRIKRLRTAAKMSQAQLADACGWKSQSRIGNYEADSREPSFADIESIAKALRVDKSELLLDLRGAPISDAKSGTTSLAPVTPKTSSADLVAQMLARHGKNLPSEARQRIADAVRDAAEEVISGNVIQADFSGLKARPEEIIIRQYDVRASMGHGQVPGDYNEVIRNLVIREDVLREKGITYTSTHSLAMITGWGQSMEGTINDKDPLIVDKGVNEYAGDGIYVLTWHEHLFIKRIQMLDSERFLLVSDNPHVRDQEARIEDVTVHAKVLLIWNARKA
ncbi:MULTISPECIES: XRE family transcriptional regulator [unclassified Pseudomonas]|uniref:XRE family transcriptional regulator n=1 Tax=unclassified Pseudomonas TaxID=196821 RepID=UPI000C879430|nr:MULTISPECIES: XRE family transcriptional regulator [unclassified Pseudomonas]MDY7554255.1 XRE family transcriptional regulator [Pseudomonas sp. FG1]MEB0052329.1 XRE family transcriptional regulator [Pseudomonas sp. FG1]PMU89769.1 Cro/Cl family transcriptional regulator [Pseudomonas sp. GW704-F3]PMU94935.1 Cro/Cl family transcriptional regulator [Pseudomonas sp. GW704-F5]PMV06119.1 Cro/Cl family transcriptional regulator [Pseudomonas sp. MPBD4-3]